MNSRFLVGSLIAMFLASTPVYAQHGHAHAHSSTHYDAVGHGNHSHILPHTTTHYDQAYHHTSNYAPHVDTHYHQQYHNGHIDSYPHTTTHNHLAYPNTYGVGGGYYQSPLVYPAPLAQSSNAIPSQGVVTAPPPSTIVANKIPVNGNGAAFGNMSGRRTIVLSNPRDNGGEVSYTVNSYSYTIRPGESQTLALDRDWVIKFDNGMGKQIAYRLGEGKYEFAVSPERGWDVARRPEMAPAPRSPLIVNEPPPSTVNFVNQ